MTSCQSISAPEGLLPAEQLEYWRDLAQELYALAKQYAEECAACGGCGECDVPVDGIDCIDCIDCADIRAAIDKAEGRS